jgi:aspartate kinase
VRVALLGAGTVGQSVLGLLSEHAAGIAARAGEPVSVRSIVVRDRRKPRSAAVPPELLTTDGLRAVTDPTVDAVVEVMGGLSPAREWVLAALAAGKPVVTANKALVAECGPDLFDAADRGGTDLFFEAAAAGAVPIVRALKLSLAAERTVRIAGILNGSTNFLLEALERGAPAAQAVAEAQALGYLEADPSDDLSGRDAQRKLAILASIAFSCRVLPEDIATAGVEGLEAEDLAMAAELGRRVKLLAEAEQTDAGLALSVGPVLLPHDHPLSQIRGSANAVLLSGHPAGDTLLAGLGAGGGPTATAVLGDLIEAARPHPGRGGVGTGGAAGDGDRPDGGGSTGHPGGRGVGPGGGRHERPPDPAGAGAGRTRPPARRPPSVQACGGRDRGGPPGRPGRGAAGRPGPAPVATLPPAVRAAPGAGAGGRERPVTAGPARLVVQKYGGSSLSTAERRQAVARRVAAAVAEGHRLAVVVSAPGDMTDDLLAMAGGALPARELDLLLATGEQASAALMAGELTAVGVRAVALTGGQAGIRTDDAFGRARIVQVDATRLRTLLQEGITPVVAGFQGVTDGGDVTTLGRGGSDLTAVALAAALAADACEIYSDVDGVYTADPRLVPAARLIERVAYADMLEAAGLGAQVLFRGAVAYAEERGVPLHLYSSFAAAAAPGTVVAHEGSPVVSIALHRGVVRFDVRDVPDRPGVAGRILRALARHTAVVDFLVQTPSFRDVTTLAFTVPEAAAEAVRLQLAEAVTETGGVLEVDARVAMVSIVGRGLRGRPEAIAEAFDALGGAGVNIQMVTSSERRVSCLVAADQAERAVRVLHDAFPAAETDSPS